MFEVEEIKHIPVLPEEVIYYLKPQKNGIYVDATLGGGGHTEKIKDLISENGKIVAIDQDSVAIEIAKKRLARYGKKIEYVHDNFRNLDLILEKLEIKKVDGIFFDLGVSIYQLEDSKRGFSFSEKDENLKARLDMRMNPEEVLTAYKVINEYKENQLRDIFFKFGEEPFARKIARQIVLRREKNPLVTINDLLMVIKSATPPKYRWRRGRHYASKVFRAIRMEVNQELMALEEVLPKAINAIKKTGRLVIISFHSLEDRIVKQKFKEFAGEETPLIKILTKKPVGPSKEEIERNPKARSAKLRAAERT